MQIDPEDLKHLVISEHQISPEDARKLEAAFQERFRRGGSSDIKIYTEAEWQAERLTIANDSSS